jgi:hypothetical protein
MISTGKLYSIRFQCIKMLSVHDRNKLVQMYQTQLKKKKEKMSYHIFMYDISTIHTIPFNNISDILQCNLFISKTDKTFQKYTVYQICGIENIILRKVCVRRNYLDILTKKVLYYDDLQLSTSHVELIKADPLNYIQTYITNDSMNIPLLNVISY